MIEASGLDSLDCLWHVCLGRAVNRNEDKARPLCGGKGFKFLKAFGMAVSHATDDDVVGPGEIRFDESPSYLLESYVHVHCMRIEKKKKSVKLYLSPLLL